MRIPNKTAWAVAALLCLAGCPKTPPTPAAPQIGPPPVLPQPAASGVDWSSYTPHVAPVLAELMGEPTDFLLHREHVFWLSQFYPFIEIRRLDLAGGEETVILHRDPASGDLNLMVHQGSLLFMDSDRNTLERLSPFAPPPAAPEVMATRTGVTDDRMFVTDWGLLWFEQEWSGAWGLEGGELQLQLTGEEPRTLYEDPELQELFGLRDLDIVIMRTLGSLHARTLMDALGHDDPRVKAAIMAAHNQLATVAIEGGELTPHGPIDNWCRPAIHEQGITYGHEGTLWLLESGRMPKPISPRLGQSIEEVLVWQDVVYAAVVPPADVTGVLPRFRRTVWVAVPMDGSAPTPLALAGYRSVATPDGILQLRPQARGPKPLELVPYLPRGATP
jgi:hypothetical protein